MSEPETYTSIVSNRLAVAVAASLMVSCSGPGEAFATLVLAAKLLAEENVNHGGAEQTDDQLIESFSVALKSIKRLPDAAVN